jgi:hypothetical protein
MHFSNSSKLSRVIPAFFSLSKPISLFVLITMNNENIIGFTQAPNLDKIANVNNKTVVVKEHKPYVYNYGNKRVILPDGTIALLEDAEWDNHKFQE